MLAQQGELYGMVEICLSRVPLGLPAGLPDPRR